VNSKISTHIVGHVIAAPRTFNLRTGVGCELRITISRRDYDDDGVPFTRERRVKVVTYDTAQAEHLVRNYKLGDFVEILSDDVRVERAWQNTKKQWVSGSAVFTLSKIRKVTAVTPENGQAEDAAARAEASVLDGVTASSPAEPAESELAPAGA
jgi:hypothetical protein